MTRQPDEDYDVVVHYFGQRGSSGTGRPTRTIWFGGEKQGERRTLEAARELACDGATVHSRPAWLLDETGYPLRPIEWVKIRYLPEFIGLMARLSPPYDTLSRAERGSPRAGGRKERRPCRHSRDRFAARDPSRW